MMAKAYPAYAPNIHVATPSTSSTTQAANTTRNVVRTWRTGHLLVRASIPHAGGA